MSNGLSSAFVIVSLRMPSEACQAASMRYTLAYGTILNHFFSSSIQANILLSQ